MGPYSGFGDAMLRLGADEDVRRRLRRNRLAATSRYANDPSFHGVQAVPRDTLIEVLRAWRIATTGRLASTAVGDAAVDLALDAFEAADREKSITDKRWSLIHAVFASPDAMARARSLGVVISAQQLLVYAFAADHAHLLGRAAHATRLSPHRTWLDARPGRRRRQ